MTTIEVLTLLAAKAISQNEAKRLLALPEDQRAISPKSKGGRPKGSGDEHDRQGTAEKRFEKVLDEVAMWAECAAGPNKDKALELLMEDWTEDFRISTRGKRFKDPATGRVRRGFAPDYDPANRGELALRHADAVQDSRLPAGPRDEFDHETDDRYSFTAPVKRTYGVLRRSAGERTRLGGKLVSVAMSQYDARRFYPTVEEVAIAK